MSLEKRTNAEDPGGVRERILDAAMAILRESGIQGLSQIQVARRADVRQSHLTYYFPKRHDLAEAVTVRFVDGMISALQDEVARHPAVSSNAMLERVADAITDAGHMRMFTGVIVEADTDSELRSVLVRETLRLQSALAHLLDGKNADERAGSLLASLWGRGLYAFLMRPDTPATG